MNKIAPNRDLIWIAKYNNGQELREYQDNKFNDFYSIDKDNLSSFGLMNELNELMYEVDTGTFIFNNKRLNISLKHEDTIIPITESAIKYNDCITFKKADHIVTGAGFGTSKIVEYNYGYKARLDNMNIKIIVCVPLNRKAEIQIHITPDYNYDCDLIITIDNKPIGSKIKLKEKVNNLIRWSVG